MADPDVGDGARLPIKLRPCSNGEYVPPPVSPVVAEAVRRAQATAAANAHRLGMSRRRFLSGLCGSAVTLSALAACAQDSARSSGSEDPSGTFSLPAEAPLDRDAAADALSGDEFIMDVQNHLLEYDAAFGSVDARRFGARFPQAGCGLGADECYSIESYLDLLFLQSDTSMAVLSAIPIPGNASPLSIEVMQATRRLLGAICDDARLLVHGQSFPGLGDPQEAFAAMALTAADHDVSAWKLYTHSPGPGAFWLDDRDPLRPQVGADYIRTVAEIGPPIICVHKGLGSGSPQASPDDIGPAAAANPDVSFVVYHSGYEVEITEGPLDLDDPRGVDRLVAGLRREGVGPGANVYAELGSTWRNVMRDPDQAGHVLGKLLVAVGEDNVVWGTDSIWYGSPQDQIQAFRAFEITAEAQERWGYPALTPEVKAKILGLNSAALYAVDPVTVPCTFTRAELQAEREDRELVAVTLGPRDAGEVAALLRAHGGLA